MPQIQSLRGIAILSVFLFHLDLLFKSGFFHQAFKYGHWGVQLFFLISGYIMCYKINSYASWHHFCLKRFLRIAPAVWICLAIYLTLFGILKMLNTSFYTAKFWDLVLAIFFVNPFIVNGIFDTTTNYPFQILWTLSVELTYYILLGLVHFTFRRSAQFSTTIIFTISLFSECISQYFAESILSKLSNALGFQYLPYFILGSCFFLMGRSDGGGVNS